MGHVIICKVRHVLDRVRLAKSQRSEMARLSHALPADNCALSTHIYLVMFSLESPLQDGFLVEFFRRELHDFAMGESISQTAYET